MLKIHHKLSSGWFAVQSKERPDAGHCGCQASGLSPPVFGCAQRPPVWPSGCTALAVPSQHQRPGGPPATACWPPSALLTPPTAWPATSIVYVQTNLFVLASAKALPALTHLQCSVVLATYTQSHRSRQMVGSCCCKLVAALVASVVAWPTSSRYATSKLRSAACRHKAHSREDDDVTVG